MHLGASDPHPLLILINNTYHNWINTVPHEYTVWRGGVVEMLHVHHMLYHSAPYHHKLRGTDTDFKVGGFVTMGCVVREKF